MGVKKSNCEVWGESDLPPSGDCNWVKTFVEAEDLCAGAGARLCTADEVDNDCTRGSGCQFDHEHVWTSDDWTSSANWAITTTAPRANEFSPDGITTTTTEATLGWTTTDTGITDK